MIIYTVKGGDTLSQIAERYAGDHGRWREIRLLRRDRGSIGPAVVDFRFTFQDSSIWPGDLLLIPADLTRDD